VKLYKKEKNGVMIVTATQRLDGATSPELEKYLTDIASETSSNVILDLGDLEYISSAGLRVVLATAKNLKTQKRELFISGLTGPVSDVFQLSGFSAILKIFDTNAQALEHCKNN
jgi:anti-anti-sigma factor